MNPAPSIVFTPIEEALAAFARRKILIVVDDEDRENEGDFVCAGEHVTPDVINFFATHGRWRAATANSPN